MDPPSRSLSAEETTAAIAALALFEGRRQFEGIFLDSPIGYARLGLDGLIAGCNASFGRFAGIAPDLLVNRTLPEIVVNEDRAMLHALRDQVLNGDCTAAVAVRLQRPDGSLCWNRISLSLVRDDAGRPLWMAALAEDETASKLTAWRTLREKERLRAAVDGAHLGTFHWDLVTGRIEMSDVGMAYLGRTAGQPIDLASLRAQIHADDYPAARDRVRAAAETAGMFDMECRVLWPDGSTHWLSIAGNALADAYDRPTCVEGVIIDIGARKAADEAMRRDAVALASTASSLKDLNAQLTRSVLSAQQATTAKTSFLANMSHEIRTPLNAIVGLTHLLRNDGATPAQTDRLIKIDTASRHLLSIINAILDLAKIEAGKLELESTPVDIGELVENVVTMVQQRADAKHLRLCTQVDTVPAGLVGDPTRLQQALLNYVTNAIKFSASGSVHVGVGCVETNADSALIRFEVRDSGPGIDAETIRRLFAPFEQADNSTTRLHGGTGLGLAITKQFAGLMGGDAGVSSVRDTGSTFWFTARLTRSGVPKSTPAARATHARDELLRHHAGRRVLVVEDDPINQEVATALLETVDQVVDRARDGAESVQMVAANRYDLILMDVQMPRMDGLEATRRIRAQPGASAVPIIALTASAFESDRRECIAAGMSDYLPKPIDPDQLFALMLRWYPRVASDTPA
jgi:PAS domain S-box-containing protein